MAHVRIMSESCQNKPIIVAQIVAQNAQNLYGALGFCELLHESTE